MKSAIWATPGPKYFNFGDVLQHLLIEEYFKDKIEFKLAPIALPLDKELIGQAKNIIVGPGGILVGTQGAKALYKNILNDENFALLDEANTSFHIWSSGVLWNPSEEERRSSNELFSRSRFIATRANIEIDFIKSITPDTNPVFSPCSTIFMDKILGDKLSKPNKADIVVLNVNAANFENRLCYHDPTQRFVDYAKSEGLDCMLMSNCAHVDTNPKLLESFNLIRLDSRLETILVDYFTTIAKEGQDAYPFGKLTTAVRDYAFRNAAYFPERHNNARFAFGKRLHSWLPFFSFNTPAAFIGAQARRGMPVDYFGEQYGNDFLCDIPVAAGSLEDLHKSTDAMIDKLKYYIKNEDMLVARIAERREELWEVFETRAAELYDSLD